MLSNTATLRDLLRPKLQCPHQLHNTSTCIKTTKDVLSYVVVTTELCARAFWSILPLHHTILNTEH